MATLKIRDNSIWIGHIEDGKALRRRLSNLRAGDTIELDIRGVVGKWERMKDGSDGRPTFGLKPLAQMRDVWNSWQVDRGQIVELREVVTADTYLQSLATTLTEWTSVEDEEAFGDL